MFVVDFCVMERERFYDRWFGEAPNYSEVMNIESESRERSRSEWSDHYKNFETLDEAKAEALSETFIKSERIDEDHLMISACFCEITELDEDGDIVAVWRTDVGSMGDKLLKKIQ